VPAGVGRGPPIDDSAARRAFFARSTAGLLEGGGSRGRNLARLRLQPRAPLDPLLEEKAEGHGRGTFAPFDSRSISWVTHPASTAYELKCSELVPTTTDQAIATEERRRQDEELLVSLVGLPDPLPGDNMEEEEEDEDGDGSEAQSLGQRNSLIAQPEVASSSPVPHKKRLKAPTVPPVLDRRDMTAKSRLRYPTQGVNSVNPHLTATGAGSAALRSKAAPDNTNMSRYFSFATNKEWHMTARKPLPRCVAARPFECGRGGRVSPADVGHRIITA